MVAMVVAMAYEKTLQMSVMTVATGWKQQAFGFDEAKVAVKKNEEDVQAYLGVERTVEEKSGSFEDLDVP